MLLEAERRFPETMEGTYFINTLILSGPCTFFCPSPLPLIFFITLGGKSEMVEEDGHLFFPFRIVGEILGTAVLCQKSHLEEMIRTQLLESLYPWNSVFFSCSFHIQN
jgi:hypothetical protein